MVCPIQPIHQSAAIFQFLPFDIHRNDLLIERKQKKLILFQGNFIMVHDFLQVQRRIQVLPVLILCRRISFNVLRGHVINGLSPRIVGSRTIIHLYMGTAFRPTDVPVNLCRTVEILSIGGRIARHEIHHVESSFFRLEMCRQDVGMRHVRLCNLIIRSHLKTKMAPFLPVQYGRKYGRRIKFRKTQPFNSPFFRYEGGGRAIPDYAVVQILHDMFIFV